MGMISTASQENPTAAAEAESTSSAPSSSSTTLIASFTPLSKLKYLEIHMIEGSDGHVLQSIQHLTALEEYGLYDYNGDGMELEWQGLRKLQYLTLSDHPKLASLPMGLQQATSLRNLDISNCSSLTTLPEWICEIISLQSLDISNCPNFTSLPALRSLQSLDISDCPNFTSLPALTSLQSLYISNCPNLTSLPALTSLQSLNIFDCPNLTSLPAPTSSLNTLNIQRCPILVESCKSQDWLARIKNLEGDLAPPKEKDPEQTETNEEYELKTRGFTKIFGRCSGSTSQ